MRFQLNFKSGKPVYLQLVDQVKPPRRPARSQAGEPLPSIRPLAEDLRVNRNTVAKAYAELESQRVIETIAGKGCFVRDAGSPFKKDVRSNCWPTTSMTPSSRRITCRSQGQSFCGSPKIDSMRSSSKRVRAAKS